METKFKRIRAKDLLANCNKEIAEREKYVTKLLGSDWKPLNAEAYEEQMQAIVFNKGYIEALKKVTKEILSWCY